MKSTALAIFAMLVSPIAIAYEICAYPGTTYKVTKSLQFELVPPAPSTPLIAWTTGTSFVLYAKQKDFIDAAKAHGEKHRQKDIHDLYRWIESNVPSSLILLDEFDGDHSEKRRFFMMELAAEGKVFIRAEPSGEFLRFATVEWFECSFGESAESGGRRIRKDNDVTILLKWGWIS